MASNALQGVTGAAIAAYALTFQGVKYLWGGTSPTTGFDCSGFAQYIYKHRAGIDLPRVTTQQATVGTDVLGGPYLPGDLLFFFGNDHEGVSLGGSRFVHAPHTGTVVQIGTLGGAYQPSAARRVLSDSQAAAGNLPGVSGNGKQDSTWSSWARSFLAAMQAPVSTENMRFVLGWLAAENPGSGDAWNPLATTLKTKSSLKGGGVQAYSSEQAGLDATVQTMQSGQYGAVRSALRSGASTQASWDALRASPWDAGHYASEPTPPYNPADATRLIVGAKSGGGSGLLGSVTGTVGNIAGDAWNLPGSVLGAAGGVAGDAASAALGPVGDAITSATSAITSEAESLAKRAAYGAIGLVLGIVALVMIMRTVGASPPGLPGGSSSSGAAGAASGAAGAARNAGSAAASIPEAAVALA